MTRRDRNALADIIRINPYIYGLQDKIDEETELVIGDMYSPTKKLVARLTDIDNRRRDLCNLKVLYGMIERELGDKFCVLKLCAKVHADCSLYERALYRITSVGYDAERVRAEFGYLFDMLPKVKKAARDAFYASASVAAAV